MSATVLDIGHLSKTYPGRRGVRATNDVSLSARAGEVVGLLGHNGAGKTTLVNQIVGLLRPDGGSIRVAGCDAVAAPHEARRLVSVQAQANVPITGLSPRTAVNLVGRIRGGTRREVSRRAGELLAALELEQWASRPSQNVSGGVARLTAFAMAAVVPGRLVILDEPTNDVDPMRRRLLWGQIRRLADEGAAVLLVTHNVREAESSVDRLVLLDAGSVVAAGTPEELSAEVRRRRADSAGPAGAQESGPARPAEFIPEGMRADAAPMASAPAPLSLEDVYLELVGCREDAPDSAPAYEEALS
ncbi:ABC transporter ATP-binding protein [Brevibacterium album]|uniref:ABC transporter ATP-binding protein n=1 Tax=Brevibacterium album TaxID=417948 RepID=UPI00040213D7|nr:ABC transporter ATP-binding protein [Brevibacterium album]